MIFKSLFRRRGRTILTVLGIAIGVTAIVALGALADGMREGYSAIAEGSRADLVVTQAGQMDVSYSGSLDESIADELRDWPEVADVDGLLIGIPRVEGMPYFVVFGYDPEGFAIAHFRIVEGQGLAEARAVRGSPLLLGRRAADNLDRQVGDTLDMTGGTFRIVGIYETGNALEEGGAVIALTDAQTLLQQPRHVAMFYVRLRDAGEEDRFRARLERRFPDLIVSTTSEFADRQQMIQIISAFATGIAALAVVVGGVGMTNALFMSVFERTREIGLLRAVGWRRGRVLRLILGESLALSLLGGGVGIVLGMVATLLLRRSELGILGGEFSAGLFTRAVLTVVVLGLAGGAYPAWWASRLLPLEALRYEGGGGAQVPPFIPGGMAVRNLWRRRTRTALTTVGISVGIAAMIALGGISQGLIDVFSATMTGSQADIMAIQADVSDTYYSAIDESTGARIAALPEVEAISGMCMVVAGTEELPFLMAFGYQPREFPIRRFHIVEGQPLTARRQAIVGRQAAETLGLQVGDTLRLLETSFRVVGIYETGVSYEDGGVVIGLAEAQAMLGKPHQVMIYLIKLRDPGQIDAALAELAARYPELNFSRTSEIAEVMPDMQNLERRTGQIAWLAVLIGGVGMLNTMLMSVLERTREIGVLRALGWRRRQVLGMILRESLVLSLVGGVVGTLVGLALAWLAGQVPATMGAIHPHYEPALFARVLVVALVTGAIGGLYPAWRATRMRPVEALRYE